VGKAFPLISTSEAVFHSLMDARRFRILCVIDDFSRECLALVADTSLSGVRLTRELDQLIAERGKPQTIVRALTS